RELRPARPVRACAAGRARADRRRPRRDRAVQGASGPACADEGRRARRRRRVTVALHPRGAPLRRHEEGPGLLPPRLAYRAGRAPRADDQGRGHLVALLQPAGALASRGVPALRCAGHRLVGLPQVSPGDRRRRAQDEAAHQRPAATRPDPQSAGGRQRAGANVSELYLPHQWTGEGWWQAYVELAAWLEDGASGEPAAYAALARELVGGGHEDPRP